MLALTSLEGVQAATEPEIPDAEVRAVVVSGNERVEAVTILDAITRTQPGKPLRREDVQADMQAILDLGYFKSVSVDIQSLSTGRDGGGPQLVRVVFSVVENPVLRRVVLEPSDDLAPVLERRKVQADDVAALLQLPTGQVAHGPTITRQVQELPALVWQRFGVLVMPSGLQLQDDGTLQVALVPVKVGAVDLEGNEKTKDYVITRELRMEPGEVLVRSDLELGLRRVLMLGLFEEVNADLREVPERPDEVAVVVRVKERRTGNVQLGVTWTVGEGPAGFVEISDGNFLGRAQQVGLTLSYGGYGAQRYHLSFTEPYLDARGTSLGVKVGWEQNGQPTARDPVYVDRRYGGELTLGRPLSEYTRGFLTFANWETQAIPAGGSPPEDAVTGTLRSVGLSTVTDTSDHPYNPTTGHRLRLSTEVAGLGGDFHFVKAESSYSHYVPVTLRDSRHVLAGRLSVGRLIPTGGSQQTPDQERFRLGGADGLRGYRPGTVVGDTMLLANLEYRFPIYKPVSGVLFLDAGQAWAEGDPVDLGELRWDAGFGLRIDIGALGMIRLDYGMSPQEQGQFHFSIGQQF
ncbi:BamA/OMP85 family outer membrane protein [Geochorda subterranea]|uniref:BamA/TamA family outer membrane protein n=1 Tax=Geochorda subterranea TaxID=3109564 RepID=A0ABZ1BPW8_9FIRM|nr:BamA/TamA family outer membrane protein [Limnochorda sp. LNt]WRP14847.1 BamA/TamA family outer membrane protein [Limnochorda sp. LNt]